LYRGRNGTKSKEQRARKKEMEQEIIKLENTVVEVLKTIYDPEIPVDVFELGLIYEVRIDEDKNVTIEMTLTSPNCPVAESMPKEVEDKVAAIDGVNSAKVNIVFDPPWDKDMMSEEAKLELGFL
jgi:FeS assembly SUF system protein